MGTEQGLSSPLSRPHVVPDRRFAGSRTPAPEPKMSPHLPAPELRRLTERLRARHRELREAIRAQFADHDDPDTMALRNRLEDTDDWAGADAMAGQDIAMVARDVAEIGEVEDALRRIADGSYGQCSDCEEPIPAARLDAYPTARRCIRCQEAAEKRSAASGG